MEYWEYPFDKSFFWKETNRWTDRKRISEKYSEVAEVESTIVYMTRILKIMKKHFSKHETFRLEYNEIVRQRKAIMEMYKKLNNKSYKKFVLYNPKTQDDMLIEKNIQCEEKKPKTPINE